MTADIIYPFDELLIIQVIGLSFAQVIFSTV